MVSLQEELATIFKSVTLHYDALVQYDELDALFSQFVVNGQIKGACLLFIFFALNSPTLSPMSPDILTKLHVHVITGQ